MAADLDDFLEAAMARPFDWGADDCILFPADWVRLRIGSDPARQYRGSYRSAGGAEKIIRRAGGLETLAELGLASAGWTRSQGVRRGQVGLLPALAETTHGVRPSIVGGICLGGGWWASRSRDGVTLGQAQPVICWRPG